MSGTWGRRLAGCPRHDLDGSRSSLLRSNLCFAGVLIPPALGEGRMAGNEKATRFGGWLFSENGRAGGIAVGYAEMRCAVEGWLAKLATAFEPLLRRGSHPASGTGCGSGLRWDRSLGICGVSWSGWRDCRWPCRDALRGLKDGSRSSLLRSNPVLRRGSHPASGTGSGRG